MVIAEIVSLIEKYINGDSVCFDWKNFEKCSEGMEVYYRNVVERLIKFYDTYLDDSNNIRVYLSALRCFLVSFQTDIEIKDKDLIFNNNFGLKINSEKRVYASMQCPNYLNEKFVFEAFQVTENNNVELEQRYYLKTNNYIEKLTGIKKFYSEAQKLCVMGVLKMPQGYSSLAVLPTGGGKSLITQTLAYKEKGLTIVIVPTISLAIDQEISAKNVISRITTQEIFSYSSGIENSDLIISAIKKESAKLLFISPEALIKNEDFSKAIFEANKSGYLKNIVIDEVHMVVEWGDYFRTDYQALEPWRKKLISVNPSVKTVLLSATVDNNTKYILKNMFSEAEKWIEFRCDSLRKEPRYCIVKNASLEEKKERLLEMINLMPHPIIVYTMNPARAETIKKWIKDAGYCKVESFTGETVTRERDELIKAWKGNEFDIMIATSAFGMGVDKPDVRTVIHDFVPDTASLYYQELGRGGRDRLPCLSIMSICLEQDLSDIIKNKVLTVKTALGRWSSMYQSPKSERIEDSIFIDTKIKPTYNLNHVYDEASNRDIQWNIYLLLLFRRYNLIEIQDMNYLKNEERYVFKIKIIDKKLSLIDGNEVANLIERVRTQEKDKFIKEFNIIKQYVINSEKVCISDMFVRTYPYVLEYCSGCNSHDTVICDKDNRFALFNPINMQSKQSELLRELEDESLIVTNNPEVYIKQLVHLGVRTILSDESIDLTDLGDISDLIMLNFYEFRKLLANNQLYFIDGACCIVYSEDKKKKLQEFTTLNLPKCNQLKKIHIVRSDFEINAYGKMFSAVIGNNITDSLMEMLDV